MSELSDEQLAAIRANAQEYSDASTVAATVRDRMNANDAQCLLLERHEDAAHTSAADVPFLLAHIDALTAENERLRGWREECDGMMVSTSRIASERDAFRAHLRHVDSVDLERANVCRATVVHENLVRLDMLAVHEQRDSNGQQRLSSSREAARLCVDYHERPHPVLLVRGFCADTR